MRNTYSHVLTIASAALFTGLASAQEPTEGASSPPISQTELKPGDLRASNLLGAMVKRLSGDSIGEVEDLIVSADADVRLAVISVGGVLGLGTKTIAIPFDQFTVAPDGSTVYLSIAEDELRARPAFDLDGDGAELQSAAATPTAREEQTAEAPHAFGAVSAEPHGTREDFAGAQQRAAQDADFGATKSKATNQPARALVGAEVVDDQNLAIGRINDLVVTAEPPDVQVVLELSAHSAAGTRFVAVPLAELTIPRSHGDPQRQIENVETTLTVAQLEGLPEFHY